MKLTTIVLILLLLGLLFYTADTLDVIKIVGKHSITFVTNMYRDLRAEKENLDIGSKDDSDARKD